MIHIHAPKPTEKRLIRCESCPDCEQRTWMITFCFEWYGADATCIRCGRKWCDSEWMPLDFVRQSRQKSIDSAKRYYRRILTQ